MTRFGESLHRLRLGLWAGSLVILILSSAVIGWLAARCLAQTGGVFSYGLDDPYIHLSIARNFAQHGVWGITPFEPASACSSPLWALMLSVMIKAFGDWRFWPLALGILCSLAVPQFVYFRLAKSEFHPAAAALAALAIFGVGPLHMLPFIGMEHSLQVLLDFGFFFWVWDQLEGICHPKSVVLGMALSFLICLCRFESVFLTVVPFFVFAFRRQWKVCLALSLGPILAVGGFALFSKLMGMPPLPNSLVLKGNVSHSFTPYWFLNLYVNLRARSFALFDLLVMAGGFGLSLRFSPLRSSSRSLQVLIASIVVATVLHCGFALVGIFYRYDAYLDCLLLACSVLALQMWTDYAKGWSEILVPQRKWMLTIVGVIVAHFLLVPILWIYQLNANLIVSFYAVGLAMLVATQTGPLSAARLVRTAMLTMFPLAVYFVARNRGVAAASEIPTASRDIYTQQYQMARFVAKNYPDGRVVVNDIGAMSYFTRAHVFDLWGLATNSVRDLKLKDNWNTATMKQELDGFHPDIIIAYPGWYQKNRAMPSNYVPVAKWTIPPVTTAAKPTVEFWAPSRDAALNMQSQLKEFAVSLPSQVSVEYLPISRG